MAPHTEREAVVTDRAVGLLGPSEGSNNTTRAASGRQCDTDRSNCLALTFQKAERPGVTDYRA